MQSVFRRADDVTRTMPNGGGGGACECPRGGGCFSISRRADDVTRTMSKGGGGACECLHPPPFRKSCIRAWVGGGAMSCAAPGPALALDATAYMWIHGDTWGYIGIHVDIWGCMGIYIYIYIYIYINAPKRNMKMANSPENGLVC